jgi:hypothetical protein
VLKGIDLPGAGEVWFGDVLVDNARDEGVLILGDSERIFFDKLWTSSGGDGLVLCGEAANPLADVVFINQLFAWLNTNHGVYIKHDVSRIHLGFVSVTKNDKGFEIEGPNVQSVYVNCLMSWENTTFGVNTAGATADVFCDNAIISDVCDLSGFTMINGDLPGSGKLQNRGTAVIPSGSTYVDVPHGLGKTPPIEGITVTPSNGLGNASKFWLSDVGDETFRINVDVDPGETTATFVWGGHI